MSSNINKIKYKRVYFIFYSMTPAFYPSASACLFHPRPPLALKVLYNLGSPAKPEMSDITGNE